MQENKLINQTVDQYISNFPINTQKILMQMRVTIIKAAQKSEEVISYGMPAYKQEGMLVWFAAYKNHIGFYPGANGIANFKNEFKNYKWLKGAVQFPLDKTLPIALITKIVKFKVKENLERAGKKKKLKKPKKGIH